MSATEPTPTFEIGPLADRLRAFARDPEMADDDLSLCFDAADEIERLRSVLADIKVIAETTSDDPPWLMPNLISSALATVNR